jgi:hypothetical protein
MGDPYAASRLQLEQVVTRGAGHTEPSLREAIARGQAPPELAALVDKVRRHAYKVTDEDIAALKATWSDDQLFEIVVAAALGAAGDRLRAGLAALEGVD